jgi:hypothetical protein
MAKRQISIFFSESAVLDRPGFRDRIRLLWNTECYRHTFFENGLNTDSYFYSAGNFNGGSARTQGGVCRLGSFRPLHLLLEAPLSGTGALENLRCRRI